MHVLFCLFQTQTKSYNQQASTVSSAYCIDNMSLTKDLGKNAVGKNKEKQNQLKDDNSGNVCSKDTSEFEIENDEQPLQIDTGIDVKADHQDMEKQEADKENTQINGDKRKLDDSENNPTPTKKVRPKPKPQMIENMQEYIDNNTIEKLTTTTLLHWLKERSLHCSTRDKKAELIQKVKNQFVSAST